MKNIAIIPARGGSKRLQKNYDLFFGKPLFYILTKVLLNQNYLTKW